MKLITQSNISKQNHAAHCRNLVVQKLISLGIPLVAIHGSIEVPKEHGPLLRKLFKELYNETTNKTKNL